MRLQAELVKRKIYPYGTDLAQRPILVIRTANFDPKTRDLAMAKRLATYVIEKCVSEQLGGGFGGGGGGGVGGGGGGGVGGGGGGGDAGGVRGAAQDLFASPRPDRLTIVWDNYGAQSKNVDAELLKSISKLLQVGQCTVRLEGNKCAPIGVV
jgi:hypothetical protein